MARYFRKRAFDTSPEKHVCTSTENALIKLTQRFHGVSRLGEVLYLQGPYISLEQLNAAVARLQRRHPALRSRLRAHPTNRDCFMFEEDEKLQLPIEELPRKREERNHFWLQEWPRREKDPINIGDPMAKLWLLQDPNDKDDPNGFREVVLMCEHCISDGQSMSNAAHELLQILSDNTGHACEQPLPWGISMEAAIRNSLSVVNRILTLSRFFFSTIHTLIANRLPVARVPFAEVDFDINEMDHYCHTEIIHGVLSKEMTAKLLVKCRQNGVTVTSAVTSAILAITATLIQVRDGRDATMIFTLSADTRRRCMPPVPNHDLAYHASGIVPFSLPVSAAPKTPEDLWQLAHTYSRHTNACVNAGQILACGLFTAKVYEMSLSPIRAAYIPTFGTSSWGVLPFVEQYGPWQLIGATPFFNLLRAPFPFTIVQTVNGVLTMMFGIACPLIPASTLMTIRNRCMDTLQQMIDN
ncbi:unnamed protein product [Adineta ricciae]|uniref:Phthiocerol/phthiodiolone dimycocerosyl transferase C-terminal domain-containing protein n=1 Tax=Adineta ricciae TaxID=249248 RepID=A0A814W2B5_ADIRI|nr:unnamed protein product [Adineta ricciae]CAF1196107.1 unnamed protein product [Adineta ricciae]